jgi:hypothetical protein
MNVVKRLDRIAQKPLTLSRRATDGAGASFQDIPDAADRIDQKMTACAKYGCACGFTPMQYHSHTDLSTVSVDNRSGPRGNNFRATM